MKILYDHQIFSLQRYGGISRYIIEVASRVSHYPDTDVTILAPSYVNRYLNKSLPCKLIGHYFPPLPLSVTISKHISNFISIPIINKFNPDIIHETYFSASYFPPPKRINILTVYDMIHEKFCTQFPRRDRTETYKKKAAQRADHIICISENTRKDLIEILNIPEEKTSVVYLGPSITIQNMFNSTGLDLPPFILYVGNRWGYKNFSGLLRAYTHSSRMLKDFKIVCFGGGSFKPGELSLVDKLNINRNRIIQISGDDNILSGLYSSASVFVYPSLYEGFGIPPLEAMSLGCPVACSNTSSLPEVVGNAAELFDPADEEEMCAVIERIVYHKDVTKMLIDRGHYRTRLFSWEKCARETMDIYKKVSHAS